MPQKHVKIKGELTVSRLIQEAAERSMAIEVVPNGESGTDTQVETPFGSGFTLLQEVQPGLRCELNTLNCSSNLTLECFSEPMISCSITLEGNLESPIIDGCDVFEAPINQGRVIGLGEPTRWTRNIRQGQFFKTFCVILQPIFFERFERDFKDKELDALKPFRHGRRTEVLPLSQRLITLAHNAFDHSYSGSLAALHHESNTLQFILEMLQRLRKEDPLIQEIGRKHYDRLLHARAILDGAMLTPPKNLDLARQVGTNINTLQAHFKRAFGTTVFGYVKAQRLEMARVLLRDHKLGAAEAGYKVGFSSPAAFAASYRRHFGHPPSSEASLQSSC